MATTDEKQIYLLEKEVPKYSKTIRDAYENVSYRFKNVDSYSDQVMVEVWKQIDWPVDPCECDERVCDCQNKSPNEATIQELRNIIKQGEEKFDEIMKFTRSEVHEKWFKARNQELKEQKHREIQMGHYLHAFFHEPEASADYEQWVHLATWTAEEAVSLSLGKCPTVVNSDSLSPELYAKANLTKEFRRRLNYLTRAVDAGDLVAPIRPIEYYEWFLAQDIKMPHEIQQAFDASGAPYIDYKERHKELEELVLDLRTQLAFAEAEKSRFKSDRRNTGYKIALGMAITVFGYSTEMRNKAVTHIVEALDILDIPFNTKDDTVRAYLQAAAEALEVHWPKAYPSIWKRPPGA